MKRRKENVIMKKFCTKCGHEFEAVGREVICPDCKAQAAEETKRAAVLRAKRASWTGESVPVRISGRASTLIREYSRAHDVPFAEALDALLQSTPFFANIGTQWSTIVPYKSHRRDKATSTTENKQEAPQEAQAAKASKTSTAIHDYLRMLKKEKTLQQKAVKTTAKAASKASASKASTSKTAGKATAASKK